MAATSPSRRTYLCDLRLDHADSLRRHVEHVCALHCSKIDLRRDRRSVRSHDLEVNERVRPGCLIRIGEANTRRVDVGPVAKKPKVDQDHRTGSQDDVTEHLDRHVLIDLSGLLPLRPETLEHVRQPDTAPSASASTAGWPTARSMPSSPSTMIVLPDVARPFGHQSRATGPPEEPGAAIGLPQATGPGVGHEGPFRARVGLGA